jgi:transposase-like protein
VDETYVGGPDVGLRGGREKGEKAIVVGAVEARGEGSGRVRLATIPDVTARSLGGFVRTSVEPGTTVITDGWGGYVGLAGDGYRHRPRVQGERQRAKRILPRIHRVFGNLQTWLRGTHHGVDRKNLQPYLDEFTFRFNRRGVPMAAFQTLLGLGRDHGRNDGPGNRPDDRGRRKRGRLGAERRIDGDRRGLRRPGNAGGTHRRPAGPERRACPARRSQRIRPGRIIQREPRGPQR